MFARIALTAPPDTTRSASIEVARVDRETALQVIEIHRCLYRWAELGRGNARDEARRALALVNHDGGGVRLYETGGSTEKIIPCDFCAALHLA